MALAARRALAPNAGGTPLTVTVPTWTVNGDLMYLFAGVLSGSSAVSITTPAGWNLIGVQDDGTTRKKLGVYWRIASSEPASYSVSFTGSSPATVGFIALAFDTGGATVAHDTFASAAAASGAGPIAAPAVTPTGSSDPWQLSFTVWSQMLGATLTPEKYGTRISQRNQANSNIMVIAYPVPRGSASPTPNCSSSGSATWNTFQVVAKVTTISPERIMFRGSSAALGSPNAAVVLPLNLTDGDILIADAACNSGTCVSPVGWTNLTTISTLGRLDWRTASSDAGVTYTWTGTNVTSSVQAYFNMDGYVLAVDVFGFTSSTTWPSVTPTVTTTLDQETVVCMWTLPVPGAANTSGPSGSADGKSYGDSLVSSESASADGSYFAMPTAGLTSSRSATTTTGTPIAYDAQVALRIPAAIQVPRRPFEGGEDDDDMIDDLSADAIDADFMTVFPFGVFAVIRRRRNQVILPN